MQVSLKKDLLVIVRMCCCEPVLNTELGLTPLHPLAGPRLLASTAQHYVLDGSLGDIIIYPLTSSTLKIQS